MNSVIVILGMGRSGTSFVANWLHKCGLSLGNKLLDANYNNIKGFFENKEIVRLHNSILNKSAVEVLINEKIIITEQHLQLARKIVAHNCESFQQWGWKDPRTALFMSSLWHPIIPDAKILVVFRDYKCVVDSIFRAERKTQLNRRNKIIGFYNFILDKLHFNHYKRGNIYLESWIRYNSDIIEFLKKKKVNEYYVVNVEKLLSHSDIIYSSLTDTFGLNLSYCNPNSLYEKDLFTLSIKCKFTFDTALEKQAIEILEELERLCVQDIQF